MVLMKAYEHSNILNKCEATKFASFSYMLTPLSIFSGAHTFPKSLYYLLLCLQTPLFLFILCVMYKVETYEQWKIGDCRYSFLLCTEYHVHCFKNTNVEGISNFAFIHYSYEFAGHSYRVRVFY